MIKPYDSGKNNLVEHCQRINVDELVRQVNMNLKQQILQTQVEVMGFKLEIVTSRTNRYFFLCPICGKRFRTIYKHPVSLQVGCRKCLGIKYRSQRFKGMLEGKTLENGDRK